MKKGINVDQLHKEIMKTMEEYTEEVKEATRNTAMEVSEKALGKLKEKSPKRKGKYKKGWGISTDRYGVIIHQKGKHYRLAHLLEKGHALRRGGRKVGESPAYPHIEEVEEECIEEYVSELERRLGK